MLQRFRIYFKEMYPPLQSIAASFILSGALYLLTVLRYHITLEPSMQEAAGFITVFCFLLFLRIADDFKDTELDRRLFPHRPYPSGRVTKKDLQILMVLSAVIMLACNLIWVNKTSLLWYFALMLYMILMSLWFFQKKRIQNNLLLALITHNPCMLLLNYYLLSITCTRYGISLFTFDFFCINLMLYFPALEYEVSRKIRAPKDETEYVTYSSTLGLRGSILLLLTVSFIELTATLYISYRIFPPIWCLVFLAYYLCYVINSMFFLHSPDNQKFEIGRFAKGYIYVMQGTLIVLSFWKLTA